MIILKKENGPRASSASALGLNTIIFKHVKFYWYKRRSQVSVYRTIGPLVKISNENSDKVTDQTVLLIRLCSMPLFWLLSLNVKNTEFSLLVSYGTD